MALAYVKAATLAEVPPGTVKGVRPSPGYHIVLCNVEGTVYAIDDVCCHAGGMLRFGTLDGESIECPLHSAFFNLKTGEAEGPPATEPIRIYPVRLNEEHIEVEIDV